MKKNNSVHKIPLKSWLLYISFSLFVATGVTFSKYIASTTGSDSARTAKFGEIELYETDFEDNKVTKQNFVLTPGVDITKNPIIRLESSEVAVTVFVSIEATGWEYNEDKKIFTVSIDGSSTTQLSWEVDENVATNWTYLSDDASGTVVFYHQLAPGDDLETYIINNNTISVSDEIRASQMETLKENISTIDFQAYAVQTDGFNTIDEAWHAVSEKQ